MKERKLNGRDVDGRRRAFTLVELLVVISVIALLLGLLLPALMRGREASRAVKCISNIRQLVAAQHFYATEDQRGVFPGTRTHPRGLDWIGKNNPPRNGHIVLRNGLIWPYLSNAEDVFECPTERRLANQLFSYTMPHVMGGAYAELPWPFFFRLRPELGPNSPLQPILAPLIVEEDEVWWNQSIDDGAWANQDQITIRHYKTGNLGFIDGSVSPIHSPKGSDPYRIEPQDLDAWGFIFKVRGRDWQMGPYTTPFGWINSPQ